jgi:hypothetical protein
VYLIITLFLQIGEGYSARGAGIANIAIALGTALGGALSGAVLADKFGTRVLQVGAIAQIAGALLIFIALPDMQTFNFWHIAPGMFISGVGTGLVVAALFDAILLAIKDELVSSASGVLASIQSIGSSVGVAIFGHAPHPTANQPHQLFHQKPQKQCGQFWIEPQLRRT